MSIPLLIFAILSVIGGALGSLSLIGLAKWAPLPNFLNTVSFQGAPIPEPSLATMWISTGLSILLALLGFGLAWLLYRKGFSYKESRNPLYRLVLNKYYVDEILSLILVKPILGFGRVVGSSFLEEGVLDSGSRGIAWLFRGISNGARKVQTGYIRNYVLIILFGVVLIVVYYAVRG
jgi:NADH-quinone oxidoreductase subunit L